MAENDQPPTLPGDNPIREAENDKLDRAGVAEHFARAVLALDRSEGAVVGVFGPWGSGKTSFVNLARPTLEAGGATVIEFNPWMFSGAEQLVERFLGELAAELKIGKLRAVGKALEDYGDALSGTARSIAKVGETAIRRHEGGIAGRRKKVEEVLRKRRDKPIVVVLDDVDRLSSTEIRDIFKLVRLTASFPNLVYIVLCDRERVEQALGESGLSGRDYLEKIIQLPFDLPGIDLKTLRQELQKSIESSLSGFEHLALNCDGNWQKDVLPLVINNTIKNIRHVRRYTIAVQNAVIRSRGRIVFSDILALEAIRVFSPSLFNILRDEVNGCNKPGSISEKRIEKRAGSFHDFIIQFSEEMQNLTTDAEEENNNVRLADVSQSDAQNAAPIFKFLFNRERFNDNYYEWCAYNKEILDFYMLHMDNTETNFLANTEHFFEKMDNIDLLAEFSESLTVDQLSDVILSLYNFRNRFEPAHCGATIPILCNMMVRGRYTYNNHNMQNSFRYITNNLLNVLYESGTHIPVSLEENIKPNWHRIYSLYGKKLFVESTKGSVFEHMSGDEFENMLKNDIGNTRADQLADEIRPLDLLILIDCKGKWKENIYNAPESAKLTFVLIEQMMKFIKPMMRKQSREKNFENMVTNQRIADVLDVFGGESAFFVRVEKLEQELDNLASWIGKQGWDIETARWRIEQVKQHLNG